MVNMINLIAFLQNLINVVYFVLSKEKCLVYLHYSYYFQNKKEMSQHTFPFSIYSHLFYPFCREDNQWKH